jgi:hypothetical protein
MQLVADSALTAADVPGEKLPEGDEIDPADAADAGDEPEATDPEEEDDPAPTLTSGQHRWLLTAEEIETGDGRFFESGAFTWRDLPLPFMATDQTAPGHDGARLVANIVEIERMGTEIYGVTQHVSSADPVILALQKLIDDGDLRGVSVDMDQLTGAIVVELADGEIEPVDGKMRIPIGGDTEKAVFSAARIMGATAVPFPAFAEAQNIASVRASLIAGAMTVETMQPDERIIDVPVTPPSEWFNNPNLSQGTPITVLENGRLYGHLALWKSCHRGFSECVPPPRNRAGTYPQFHVGGQVLCDDGSRVRVGHITVDGGHADTKLSATSAKKHYDESGWSAADIRVGEDEFGIWCAGTVAPGLDDLRIRKLMSHDVSGDWRMMDGNMELISLRTVPVPGFIKTMYASGELQSLVASIPVCVDDVDLERMAVAERIALSINRAPSQLMAARDSLAFTMNRHPSQLRAALANRVRGEV